MLYLTCITSVVQSLSLVQLFATQWTAACQVSLSPIISQSLPKFMSTESMRLIYPSQGYLTNVLHLHMLKNQHDNIGFFFNHHIKFENWTWEVLLTQTFIISIVAYFGCFIVLWYHFPSFWSASFNIFFSFRASLQTVNSLSFLSSENILISPSFLKDVFTTYVQNSGFIITLFQYFKMLC